jgi:hypothetical protein
VYPDCYAPEFRPPLQLAQKIGGFLLLSSHGFLVHQQSAPLLKRIVNRELALRILPVIREPNIIAHLNGLKPGRNSALITNPFGAVPENERNIMISETIEPFVNSPVLIRSLSSWKRTARFLA